jgi:hypothetical protein
MYIYAHKYYKCICLYFYIHDIHSLTNTFIHINYHIFRNTDKSKKNEKTPKIPIKNDKKIAKKTIPKMKETDISRNIGVSTQYLGVRVEELIKLLGKSNALWDDFRYNFKYL